MSRQPFWRIVILAALSLALALPMPGAAPAGAAFASAAEQTAPGEWLVRMRDDLPSERARQALLSAGLTPLREIPRIGVWVVEAPQGEAMRALNALQERGEALWHEPNGTYSIAQVHPDDPYYWPQQWNLRLIGLPDAWTLALGDPRPIAIIDTGVDLYHPDLANKIWSNPGEIAANGLDDDGNGYVDDIRGWNFVASNNHPQDDHRHGSHVAGIAAAETDNGIGIAGVAWLSPLMSLKVLNSGGSGTWENIALAIRYAADNGAHIINLSLGGASASQTVREAAIYARQRGSLVIAAAGNTDACSTYPHGVLYPAAFPEVVAVAATTADDSPWYYSCRGPEVDVAAPGVNISSCRYQSALYWVMSGTSMAAPHVAGLAALLWAYQPGATADEILQIITSTAKDVHTPGKDIYTGWGRIDAASAFFSLTEPQLALSAGATSISVLGGSAPLTATVTQHDGQPAPDGMTVSFFSTLGSVAPPTALTLGGVATAVYTPSAVGQATITATLAGYAADVLTLTVTAPRIALTSAAPSISALGGGVALTALATHADGQPAPDGTPVSFSSDKGALDPPAALTAGGVVTTTFIPSASGQATITATLASFAVDAIAIEVVPPTLVLTTTASSIPVRGGSAPLTVTVSHQGGEPAPDGTPISFSSDKGDVQPPSALTAGGIVTATFIPRTFGEVQISAELPHLASDAITLTVTPWMRIFFPHLRRR